MKTVSWDFSFVGQHRDVRYFSFYEADSFGPVDPKRPKKQGGGGRGSNASLVVSSTMALQILKEVALTCDAGVAQSATEVSTFWAIFVRKYEALL
ncbi:hypothetical protein [Paracoccus sp. JM45]|uniref:hypothetical protein n=1 Tax=Paracoccus sp. JM45 TaxID=2283626 RepID=UPI0016034203|nr:hypothetical protein [Paracoccus sp. JM45]